MATEVMLETGPSELRLAARLDAIDKLLIGALPRTERISLVAEIETRLRGTPTCVLQAVDAEPIRELNSAETFGSPMTTGGGSPNRPVLVYSHPAATAVKPPRSKAALASGLAGIAACVLLFFSPLAYVAIAMLGEMLDETIAIGGLAAYGIAMAFSGGLALLLGVVGLWRSRKSTGKVGRGWAIAGLCLGPVPFGLTTAVLAVTALSLFGGVVSTYSASSPETPVASAPLPASTETTGALVGSAVGSYYPSSDFRPVPCPPPLPMDANAPAGNPGYANSPAVGAVAGALIQPTSAEVPATLPPLTNDAKPAVPASAPEGSLERPAAPFAPSL